MLWVCVLYHRMEKSDLQRKWKVLAKGSPLMVITCQSPPPAADLLELPGERTSASLAIESI